MKNKFFGALALVAATLFVSCDPAAEEITGISLPSTATVEVGKTTTLTATVTPAGVDATIVWVSATPAVATVADGVVTGVAEGNAIITATVSAGFTATCIVTVTGEGGNGGNGGVSKDELLTYSEYYPFIMDGVTYDKISSKVVNDFRPDDTTKFLYIWDNTYNAGDGSGLNFFGNTEGYTALTVGGLGWSGAGFFTPANPVKALYDKIVAAPGDYYIHMAFKSTDNYAHCFYFLGLETLGAKFSIGSKAVYDGRVLADFTRDGSWHSVVIPFSTLDLTGFNLDPAGMNAMVALSEGVSGAALNLDAVFIYKK